MLQHNFKEDARGRKAINNKCTSLTSRNIFRSLGIVGPCVYFDEAYMSKLIDNTVASECLYLRQVTFYNNSERIISWLPGSSWKNSICMSARDSS